MGDLTEHFSRSEFACQGDNCCGHSSPVHRSLPNALEILRRRVSDHLGKDTPLIISSGFRCITHNEEVQKEYNREYKPFSSKSRHMLADAVDVMCPKGMSIGVFKRLAEPCLFLEEAMYFGGIGIYNNRLHLDLRDVKLSWDMRK